MEKAAILHYMDGNYSFMNAKGEYVFRIRTKANDASKVIFHGRDKYIHMLKSSDKKTVKMQKVATDGITDYYETAMPLDMICFRYFFELVDKREIACITETTLSGRKSQRKSAGCLIVL